MALNANAIVSLALAKSYLKIPTLETTQDSIVELFINAASDYIEAETDRKLKSQSHTEYHNGRYTNTIVLKQYPVTGVTSFETDYSGKFSGDQELIDPANYVIGDEGNSLIYISQVFPKGYNNIKIVYTAGYSTIPSDIQNGCLWLVTYYYKMRENGDIGRTSKGKGDESVNILQEAPQDVKNMIARYRRMDIPLSGAMSING